ncbi:MAG: YkvA family protein [Bacillota bacterium]|nr:YkvA family protein [Bacillota bacterium]
MEEEVKTDDMVNDEKRVRGTYDELRSKAQGWLDANLPDKYRPIGEYILLLPDMFMLVVRLLKDGRVPTRSKAMLAIVLAYLVLPFDIVPDFIPGFGILDDFIIVVYALNRILGETPQEIVTEHWSGQADLLKVIRDSLTAIDEAVNKNLIQKIKDFLKPKDNA